MEKSRPSSVVARPVDDAEDGPDAIGGEPFLHRADEGDAARHRGLEAQHHLIAPRFLEKLRTMMGKQGLVGGDHVLAGRQRPQDEGARWLQPAHQLDDDADVGVVEHAPDVGGQRQALEVEALPRADEVEIRDGGEGELAAGALFHVGAVGLENARHAHPHGAEPEETELDLVHAREAAPGRLTARRGS